MDYKIPNEQLVTKALEGLKVLDRYMKTKEETDELDKAL